MMNSKCVGLSLLLCLTIAAPARCEEKPLAQKWDYAPAMKKVHARFHGRDGVVLHIGDSITYANPYSQWARYGQGHSDADKAALKWMHAGAQDDRDGWFLCSVDHPDGGRSYTACGGIRIDEMLAGGKNKMPPLGEILDKYKPQMVVLMLGTNDASAGRPVGNYRKDMEKAVALMLDRGIICILSTIPPHVGRPALAAKYNDALREIGRKDGLPMIDYEREILTRRPNDWNGTLLGKDDVHPTANGGNATPTSEPTAENLRNSGYLLRGWLSVKKIEEVKDRVVSDSAALSRPRRGDAPDRPNSAFPSGSKQAAPAR
jgi:hypothetical protein